MEPQTHIVPAWKVEFLTLLRNEIREQVTSNAGDPDFRLMWAKRPYAFVEEETKKLLEDASTLLPSWVLQESEMSDKRPLALRWSGLALSQKMLLAQSFKEFFYKERKLHKK